MRTAALALLLVACSDPPTHVLSSLPDPEHGAAPSEAATATPSAAPATAPTPPPASSPAPRLRVSPETAAEVQRLVREARTLEHAGDHAGALARFDEALRLVPSQPRILCEAGFIAHRAGDDALAGRRIDAALAVFGEPRRVSERLRVPLAMCLYNRGLVAEAEADPRRAVDAFTSSIALRPNAAVDAALARARAAAAALPLSRPATEDRSTVAGLVLTDDYTLATTDVAAYERALQAGFRGVTWDGSYSPASETVVARRPLSTEGHPAVLVHTVTTSDGLTRLVISWPQSTGYQAQELELGRTGEEGDTEERIEVTELTGAWTGEYLRVDVTVAQHLVSRLFYAGEEDDERCEEDSEENVTRSWTVFCHDEADAEDEYFACVDLPTRVESSGVTSYASCGDDETEQRSPPSLARAVVAANASGVTISQVRDPDALLGVEEGPHAWEDLLFDGRDVMLTEWIADGEESE